MTEKEIEDAMFWGDATIILPQRRGFGDLSFERQKEIVEKAFRKVFPAYRFTSFNGYSFLRDGSARVWVSGIKKGGKR